jgi:hypothetical protein
MEALGTKNDVFLWAVTGPFIPPLIDAVGLLSARVRTRK